MTPSPSAAGREARCETCKHWMREGIKRGACRRYPPQIDTHSLTGYWPTTQFDAWCGEHALAAASQAGDAP